MDLGLKGKIAVVTGGSRGIGIAVAREFLNEGANVAICARNRIELNAAAERLGGPERVFAQSADMTREENVYAFADAVCARFGKIDVWVNNVGAVVMRQSDEFTTADVDKIVELCFKSTLFGAQAAFRSMRCHASGAIVNISSLAARCPTAGRSTLYGPMKAAVCNLTQTLAGEYAGYNVRVNCVLPGFTLTRAVRESIRESEYNRNVSETLLQRGADPQEIAGPVVFLAGNRASFMTAECIEVSGGRCRTLNPGYKLGDPL